MKCPIDDAELVMAERQGIEIDYCPKCRGVWLDRGELDKIIERSEPAQRPRQADDDRREFGRERDHGRDDYRRPHKKKSLLGELFDF
jgi:Zn-finger nucleic acid-binding protein